MIAHMDSNDATYLRVGPVEHDFGDMLTEVLTPVAGLRIYVAINTGYLDSPHNFSRPKMTWESCSEALSGPLTCGDAVLSNIYKRGSVSGCCP